MRAEAAPELAADLMQAMRGLASAVTVISVAGPDGARNAMTATSTTSLSMDPPSMLVCVNRATSLFPMLERGGDFCINILKAAQRPIAARCASRERGEARFAEGSWGCDAHGVPYLEDAQAAILCRQSRQVEFGTHAIVIGEVRQVILAEAIDPLVYADGGYRQLAPL